MDPVRFRRMVELVGDALELPEAERLDWLAERCGDDADVLAEARALLALAGRPRSVPLTEDLTGRVSQAASWFTAPGSHPEQIGPYRVREVLGQGGMAIVYGTHQEQPLRRDVAVKVLNVGVQTPRVVARFEFERRTLASLDHPHIAHVFDAGTTAEGLPYFAMEWVHGRPITEFCDAGRLDIDRRLALFQHVLAAVQYAHQKAIVHRDLKPSNVLVTEIDGEPVPKVIDFGIARALEPTDSDATAAHTAVGAVLGTIEYMSPEQALAPGRGVGIASDVYALGVLLYELLTGVLPFAPDALRQASPVELERLLGHSDPLPPSRRLGRDEDDVAERARARDTEPRRLAAALRGDLDNIVGVAMRKDPAQRYASVAHLAEDIQRYRDGRPVRARPATWSYRARRFVGRHRWGVSGTAAALALMLGMAGTFAVRLAAERDRARVEAHKAAHVAGFLEDLFRVPDPSVSAETDVRARELLDEGAARITKQLADEPDVQAALLATVGRTYQGLGLYRESEERLQQALALTRKLHGEENVDVATHLHELGAVKTDMGDFAGAEKLLREALALRRRLLGDGDTATAATMSALAVTLRARGKYAEAEALASRALAIQRRTLGPEHVDIAASLHNLAFILRSEGRLEESERYYREALAMRRRLLDPSHPDLLQTMGNLAVVLEARGEYAEAESLLRENLRLRRARLGEDHPSTLTALNNLAYMLWRTGQYPRADTLFEESVAIGRRVFHGDHTTLAIMLNNLGVARRRAGDLARAEALHREALAMNRRLLGDEHPRVAGDLNNLGKVLLAEGDARGAASLHRQALAMQVRLLGDDHPDVAVSLAGLAEARLALGDAAQAEDLLRRALRIRSQSLGADNPRTAATENDLGVLLAKEGKRDEAERVLRHALAVRRAALPAGHPDIAATLRELGILLTREARYAEADSMLTESRRLAVARLGEADPETRRVDGALRELRARAGRGAAPGG